MQNLFADLKKYANRKYPGKKLYALLIAQCQLFCWVSWASPSNDNNFSLSIVAFLCRN